MFQNLSPNTYIDAVQNGKKQIVKTFVQHEGIKTALNEFIDGQTSYTKSAVKVATDVGQRLYEESTKAFSEVARQDYTKFDYTKFFKVPGATTTAKKTSKSTEAAE